jgi:hypothetical protein
VLVKLQGGLGNQLFQWAYGSTEAIKRNEPVYFDIQSLPFSNPPRRYELGAYNIKVEFHEQNPGEEIHDGYYQAERYFDTERVRAELGRPKGEPNPECRRLALRINASPSCFIGVRRGDYLWPERINFHGVLPMSYYEEAIGKMPPGTDFYVFTDDPEWSKKKFPFPVVQVNGPSEKAWDLWLMSFCQYAIIANSSFQWWGSFLGPGQGTGNVIAPKQWLVGQETDIVPERWLTL